MERLNRLAIVLNTLLIASAVPLFGQDITATTESGRDVVLHADGTWEFVSTTAPLSVFFGNLHSHTSYSDGSSTPDVAYEHAREQANLDFMAITEHNHRWAPSLIATNEDFYSGDGPMSLISIADQFTEDGRFVAIYGQEFSSISTGNHANVFEIGSVINTDDVPNGEWDDLLDVWLPAHLDSEGQPAIMLLNHPATGSNDQEYGINDFGSFADWREKLDAHASLINIINGPSHNADDPPSAPSESEFFRYLNLGLHVAPTADQDNHLPNWGTAAETRTGVVAPALTKSAILTALRNRNVYASEDRNLRIVGRVNGALLGSRLEGADAPAVGSELDVELDISDPDEPVALYTIDVYADHIGDDVADIIAQVHTSGDGTVNIDGVTYIGGEQYFVFKITQTDDDGVLVDRAWLAPIWIEPAEIPAASVGPQVTLEVNEELEMARITNIGDSIVDLQGWKLISTRGGQQFRFEDGLSLAPGNSVVITSGPSAVDSPPQTLRWTTFHVWANDGDQGELRDQNQTLRAASR